MKGVLCIRVLPPPIALSLLFLTALSSFGLACIGFGGCLYPYVGCVPSSAAGGYFSPCYGGYCRKKNRLKGSRVMALNDSRAEEDGFGGREGEPNGFGSAEERREGAEKGGRHGDGDSFQALQVSPDVLFLECCQSWSLPPSCLLRCSYPNYTADTLHSMFFHSDDCPIESASIIHFCASQNQDHTVCCRQNGVPSGKCLIFCEQMPQNETRLDMSYVPCFDHFAEMKKCFYENALRSIDYLEMGLDELRKKEEEEQDQEDREEAESTFAIARPPIIFVNSNDKDGSPKHPQIEDDYTPAEEEGREGKKTKRREEDEEGGRKEEKEEEEEARWMRENMVISRP